MSGCGCGHCERLEQVFALPGAAQLPAIERWVQELLTPEELERRYAAIKQMINDGADPPHGVNAEE